jgi:hypothetical protein
MHSEDNSGDALDDVARIHPALDRLRQLVTSATILDLMATSGSYWADRHDDDDTVRTGPEHER